MNGFLFFANKKIIKYFLIIIIVCFSFLLFFKKSIYTISGDVTHKNVFNVSDTIKIDDDMTFSDLKEIISPSKIEKSFKNGYFFLKENDSTRIKYVYPEMSFFEDTPENNEVYWKTLLKAVVNYQEIIIEPLDCVHNKTKYTALKFPESDQKNCIIEKNGYVIITVTIENGNCYLTDGSSYDKNIRNKFQNGKICFLLHFKNKNEKVTAYWNFLKEMAESSQGRFEIFIH